MELPLLQKVHGFIAVLGIALAFHPWFALRRSRGIPRRTKIACLLASAFLVVTNVMGWIIYPAYRRELKADIYLHDYFWGDLFEVKEHWGFYALMLAVGGAVLVVCAGRENAAQLRQPIRVVYTLAGLLALAVAAFGTVIASIRQFDTLL